MFCDLFKGQRLRSGKQTATGSDPEALQSSSFLRARSEECPVVLQPGGNMHLIELMGHATQNSQVFLTVLKTSHTALALKNFKFKRSLFG